MQTITKYQAKYFAHYLTRRLPANCLPLPRTPFTELCAP